VRTPAATYMLSFWSLKLVAKPAAVTHEAHAAAARHPLTRDRLIILMTHRKSCDALEASSGRRRNPMVLMVEFLA
jgi:hypothetical protein